MMTTTAPVEKKIRRWPIKMATSTDLAGFLRRKMVVAGSTTTFKFGTAERFLRDILDDWKDAYEIAVVIDAVIDAKGPTDQIWNLLDLRRWPRLRGEYAPVKGTARYTYLARYADVGADKQELLALIEDLEDAIVAEATATVRLLKTELDRRLRGLEGRPVTPSEAGGDR
jgi:hypothetical protein